MMTKTAKKLTKLVILLDAWQPLVGGGQQLFSQLVTGLVKHHGYQIEIITRSLKDKSGKKFNQSQSLLNGRLIITRLGPTAAWPNLLARIWFTFQSVFVALQRQPDIYLASTFLPAFSLQLIKLFKSTPNCLVVIGFGAKNKLFQWLEKFITRTLQYDRLITDDYSYYQSIKCSRKIDFIPNGVNLPKSTKLKKHPHFTFLFVGRNEPRKGVTFLKQAFKAVKAKHPQAQLKLLGPGFSLVSQSQLHQELFQSHCLVLPSLREGHPLILFEAWAHQLPVIATSVGSLPRFVNSDNGFLVEPGSVPALTQAMLQAVQPEKLDQLGKNGLRLVKQWTWAKTVNRYHQALTSLRQ